MSEKEARVNKPKKVRPTSSLAKHKLNHKFPLIRILPGSNKAVSDVVGIILVVMLTVFIVAVIWVVINNFVRERTETSKSCFDISQGIIIENTQTCYNSSSKELKLYLSVKDVDIDSSLVSVSSEGKSGVFRIKKSAGLVRGVSYIDGSQSIKLPGKEGGLAYLVNMSAFGLNKPESIQVAPAVGDVQCEVSDSLDVINSC